jgi:hypothetical protein
LTVNSNYLLMPMIIANHFFPALEQHLLPSGGIKRRRASPLSISEVMTILIHFHQSHYRNFKAYYSEHVLGYLPNEFPGLLS